MFGSGRGADTAAIPESLQIGRRGRSPGASGIDEKKLSAHLVSQRSGERFLVASTDLQVVAPLVIETGEPVMALGGFRGTDPILSLTEFTGLVRSNQVRFVLLSRGFGLGRPGADPPQKEIVAWVLEHGVEVPSAAWGGPPGPRSTRWTRSSVTPTASGTSSPSAAPRATSWRSGSTSADQPCLLGASPTALPWPRSSAVI
jgi:hypothetical protein